MHRISLLVAALFCGLTILAQNEANWWYFGNGAGIHFTPSPVSISGSLSTTEGVATISDAGGNLLFYTDGITVYNRNNAVMTNGNGMLGDPSSTQSAVIAKLPGSSTIYYIFTASLITGTGIHYSVVDMSLSGGLGAVTIKNVLVYGPSTERICAVKHCNNRDIWIISHYWGSNEFRAYLFTSAGLATTYTSSSVGSINTGSSGNSIGYLKASPDGNRLAMVMRYSTGGSTTNGIIELYNFDKVTGAVSNAVSLGTNFNFPYGVEFSPNGSRLYANVSSPSKVYQYNLCAGSSAQIIASQTLLGSPATTFLGALQLAPDGKIYMAHYSGTLSVINSPNTLGTGCGFVNGGFPLSSGTSQFGLPNFISSYFSDYIPIINANFDTTINCQLGNFSYTVPPGTCTGSGIVQSLHWNFGDPASGPNDSSNLANPSHMFSDTGDYNVTLVAQYDCYADTGRALVHVHSCGIHITLNGDTICLDSCALLAPIISGGQGPKTYVWTPNIGTGAGPYQVCPANTESYKLVVSDSLGDRDSITVQVVVNNPPAATIAPTNVSCNGLSDGQALVSALGTPDFTYVWNTGGSTDSLLSGLAAGNYYVTVTDAHGCMVHANVTITEPTLLVATDTTLANVSCFGGNDGNVLASATGGQLPYSYAWNTVPAQTLITANNLVAGIYTVTVTDNNQCTATASTTVSQPTALAVNSTGINSTCNQANAVAIANASGGTVPYQYVWDSQPVQNTDSAINLMAGTYNVSVTDANNCQATGSVTMGNTGAFAITAAVVSNAKCFGASDGIAAANISVGSSPFTYQWSTTPPQSSDTAINLAMGTYSLTGSDALGCSGTASVTITQPTALSATATATGATCNLLNGSATVNAAGGTTPYTYLWNTIPTQTDSMALNIGANNYVVTVTDFNACSVTAGATVNAIAVVQLAVNSTTNASCYSFSNGQIVVSGSSGQTPYNYSIDSINFSPSTTFDNLPAGTYNIYVRDGNGCVAMQTAIINQPPLLVIDSLGQIIPSCFNYTDGQISAYATGGTPTYTYSWNPGPTAGSSQLPNIGAGDYNVTVTDANGCTASATTTLTQPDLLTATIVPDSIIELKQGDSIALQVLVLPSTRPVSYFWQPNGGLSCVDCPTPTASPSHSQNYRVIVTDSNQCKANATVQITVSPLVDLFIPNVFSPNGDSHNDMFQIFSKGALQIKASIYNRWGELVFQTEDMTTGWDGSYKGAPAPMGVYIYSVTAIYANGVSHTVNGSVTLAR